ncbi:MAG: hypothetical protein CND29_03500 [Marine Group II euryarchaeote MED-G36]|nr:MAG: hypothetical protein CND29_03500 [Marine Group II euryarchaeote MED-G36]
MMEGNMSNPGSQMPNESNSATSMIVGTTALVLVLPVVVISLMELQWQIDMGAEFKWIIYSIIFSVTIISILAISGAHITGFLPTALKIPSGVYLMALSGLNLLVRLNDFNDIQPYYSTSWFEFMQQPWVHEPLELSFLGFLIAALIMKK